MVKYACVALGVHCTFTTTAESADEVKKALFAHADVVHKDMLESMTPEQLAGLEKAVDAAIVPV